MTDKSPAPLLSLQGITKAYPGCLANDDITLDLHAGDIHALLGENGAGKSTLVKIIYGVLVPDNGQILWNGEPIRITNPAMARKLGIGMVFQHFSLFEALSVEDNIALSMPKDTNRKELGARIRDISAQYGLSLEPHLIVHELSVGERQRIEIVRCLLQSPKLLIMDEPTSVLTPQEAGSLFKTLHKLADEGCAILYISHRLSEIRDLCNFATIMRLGKVVEKCNPRSTSAKQLAALMMGEDVKEAMRGNAHRTDTPRINIKDMILPNLSQNTQGISGFDFDIYGGEILGIAGLAGNGQDQLLSIFSAEAKPAQGRIIFDGQDITDLPCTKRRTIGIHCVPEERLGHAAVPEMSLSQNACMTARERYNFVSRYGFMNSRRIDDFTTDTVKRFNVKTTGINSPAMSLSGGNLQKFIIGREIIQKPNLLIALQPTWGVDAGSAYAIHQELLDLSQSGAAILVISQDLDELFTLCDRLAVICEGQLSKTYDRDVIDLETIGLLMSGQQPHTSAEHA